MSPIFVKTAKALDFIAELEPESVDLVLIDPPYYGIVDESWDNQWKCEAQYVAWLNQHLRDVYPKLKPNGSLLMFGGIGRHLSHPLFSIIADAEVGWGGPQCGHTGGQRWNYTFRNFLTWKKRRAYGKSHDYLYCREEIVWFSKSKERTGVTFNIPLLDEKRGYKGFNEKYPAKSEFKRVSNVWTDVGVTRADEDQDEDEEKGAACGGLGLRPRRMSPSATIPDAASTVVEDIPELMRPERNCQKPIALLQRLIRTHSNEGDLVVDFFAGYGSTGIAAIGLDRRFIGCEAIEADAIAANERCRAVWLG